MSQDAADRSKRVLAALVREYIASGEPVRLVAARDGRWARRVVGDGPEHPGPARGRGLRAAAAHLGRAHSDRSRLSVLRRPAARVEAVDADGAPPSRRGCGATARTRCSIRCCPQASHVRLAGVASSVGFAIRPAHEAAVFDRVEFVPLGARARPRRHRRRGGHVMQKVIEIGEPLERRRPAPGGQLPERRVLRPAAAPRARSGAASGSTRSGCSTTRCWRAPCGWRPRPSRICRTSACCTSTARRRCSTTSSGLDARHAAGAAADDRGEAAAACSC